MKDGNRQFGQSAPRPRLLMLSHCVPAEETGTGDRARAWQLITTFGRSHDIHLACQADGPVSLAQWRALHARTKRIVIEPISRLRRALSRLVSMISPATGEAIAMHRVLRQPIQEWSARLAIEAVLCTRTSLLEATRDLVHARHMVDLYDVAQAGDARLNLCDTVIIGDATMATALKDRDVRTIFVPLTPAALDSPMRLTPDTELPTIPLPMPLHKAA